MSATEVTIPGPDGHFMGYLATPESGSGPGIVVIQEIFGVNKVMRGICDTLAAQGFMALCPDLFWRIEPGIQLDDNVEAELQRAFDLYGKYDVDTGMKDIAAAIAMLRKTDGCNGKVGTVGYCLGGFLAYLSATRTDTDAAVGYYGVAIESKLDEADKITKPVMLHIAEEDEFVSKEAQSEVKEGLASNELVTIHSYPGMAHAFAREGGSHYNADAANEANSRTLSFFKSALG